MFRTVSPICTAGVAVSLVCASGLDLAPALAQVQGAPTGPAQASPRTIPISARTAPLELRLDRRSDAVDVVISGVGAGPQLQQSNSGAVWLGRLYVATPTGLRRGTQTLSLPEAGFQSISLSGAGSQFNIQVAPVPGFPLGRPLVSADGKNLILTFAAAPQASQQTFSRDLTIPGRVPQPDMVPPLQPRAVAPPVGDMAVGSILIANSGFVNVSGPPITMTMQNAPARTVLMSLSRMGGYGFVYVNADASSQAASGSSGTQAAGDQASSRPISISFKNENYASALNSVLMASGLQGKVEGNTLLAGPNVLSKGFGAQLSKVYRLNQVGANSAADYLANLGARVSKTNTTTTAISQGVPQSQQVSQASTTSTTQSSTTTTVNSYGADNGPLLGLQATTDSRLSTITLVGSPALVAVAETYLRQLDLRQRQVALSVKILDVSLDNQKEVDNSFAFRYGNNFIVNDSGQMLGAFGSLLPPGADAFGRGYPQDFDFEIGPDGKITSTAPPGYNAMGAGNLGPEFYPPGNQGSIFKDATRRNPGQAYPPDNFYNFLKAKIESTSTKVLASPTLILSENSEELRTGDDQLAVNIQSLSSGGSGSGGSSGSSGSSSAAIGRTKANESYVTVGEQVITNYTVTTGTQGNGNSCQPQFGIAGLTFGARVSKIDDNGFVTFSMSPAISATVRQFPVQGCGPIDILAIRRLDTGSARVRDGQTLILTGVISDRDTEAVTKWPILGDIPIIGQFFRNSGSNRAKRELVILVTPRIIDDTQGGSWGYGYQPSTRDARRFMGTSAGQSPY
ncbi:MAG: ral secretion pathway protein [Cyanobacteriota bacterium]